MSDNTKIEWTDATVNAVNGCSVVSPGCTNCYAMRLAGTRMKNHPSRVGLTQDSKAGPVWTGEVRLSESALLQPLRWNRPRRIFWNAHGDLFHPAVPDAWIDRVFAVCALTPQHTHQILTKRPERMREWFAADDTRRKGIRAAYNEMGCIEVWLPEWPLPNVWLGVSVEDQQRANERIPHLLATPAAVRFLSMEPLLGPIDLLRIAPGQSLNGAVSCEHVIHALQGGAWDQLMRVADEDGPKLDWIIVGGESGPDARPMHPDWVRSIRDQCAAAGVPFFFKQWGEWRDGGAHEPIAVRKYHTHIAYVDVDSGLRKPHPNRHSDETMVKLGKSEAGRLLDGAVHDGMPADG